MKKLGTLFILFASVLLLGACGGDSGPSSEPSSKPGPTPTQTGKIEVPATEDTKPVFKTEGGTTTFKFTASGAWTASAVNTRADSWLTVSPTSGGAGAVTLTITTTANDTYDERSGSITIQCGSASQTIVVTQKQKDAILITSDKVEIDADGGEISVEVKANVDFTVNTDVDWISQTNTRALQTSDLTFSIAENEKSSKREGHITISSGALSEKVTVYQSGNVPTIIISKDEYEVSADGEEITVEVRSNVDVEVNMPNVNWISQVGTRSISTNTYVFAISENESYDERKAEITFANKKNKLSESIKIKQSSKEGVVVDTNEYTVSINGGTLDVDVKTNVVLSVSTDVDWITQANTRALHTETLHFNIAAYEGNDSRTGTITIKGEKEVQTVKVKQTGKIDELGRVRDVLMEFYKATDGDNWYRNDNWGTNNPLTTWEGLTVSNGKIIGIDLYGLKGSIPSSFWTLTDLESLHLMGNIEYGENIIIDGLKGELPESIGNLVNLKSLWLDYHNFTGELPTKLWTLKDLEDISIDGCGFKGRLSEDIGNLTKLKSLRLNDNNLTGSIPSSISSLSNLKQLSLYSNEFTGNIPESFGNLKNLEDLYIVGNKITGNIPESFGGLKNLERLSIGGNKLSGHIPSSIGLLNKLKRLYISENSITGEIPKSIGDLINLEYLELEDCSLSGTIPSELGNLKGLKYMFLDENELTGNIPDSFGNLTQLVWLNLSSNNLSGEINPVVGKMEGLEMLNLYNNKFEGNIPESIFDLTNLKSLDLPYNNLSGEISDKIGNLKNLRDLELQNNDFTGNIPESIGKLSSLELLYLNNNRLTGNIPESFVNLSNLEVLDLHNNHLSINVTNPKLRNLLDTLRYCNLSNQTPE